GVPRAGTNGNLLAYEHESVSRRRHRRDRPAAGAAAPACRTRRHRHHALGGEGARARTRRRGGRRARCLRSRGPPRARRAAKPGAVIHQLTDLPREFDVARIAESYAANARIRSEGTRNLIAAAQAASARRFVVQSIAFGYASGGEPHPETDPLNLSNPERAITI